MFSVYGKAGRVFRGAMEELRQVGRVDPGLIAPRQCFRWALIPHDQNPALPAATESPPRDTAHRTAMAAYADAAIRTCRASRHRAWTRSCEHERFFTVPDSATLADAWALLASHKLGQAPVVNARGVLVGLISRADLLRADRLPGPDAHALVWHALLLQAVTEVMWTPVPSASADTDIRRVARVLSSIPACPDCRW